MKKLFIIAAFMTAFFITEKAQAQLNLNVGYAPELMTTKTPTHDTTLFYHGICLGLNWTFNLSDNLSLTTGAQYRINLRNSVEHIYLDTVFSHHITNERQTLIDVPITLNYDIAASEKITISPFVGPMLSWGITGETKEQWLYPIGTESRHEWYGDNSVINRFNVYGVAGIKVSFYRFTLSLGVDVTGSLNSTSASRELQKKLTVSSPVSVILSNPVCYHKDIKKEVSKHLFFSFIDSPSRPSWH